MAVETVKEQIHQLINNIDDVEFLKAVQTIISAKIQDDRYDDLSEAEMQMLHEREENYLSGKSKTYTWEEVKAFAKSSGR